MRNGKPAASVPNTFTRERRRHCFPRLGHEPTGRWSDVFARWSTDEANGYLKTVYPAFAARMVAEREGARVEHFRYDITLKSGHYDYAGPAFGIQDSFNFFTVYYSPGSFLLRQRVEGGAMVAIANATHTPSGGDHVLRIEVADVGGVDKVTVTLDPGGGQTVLMNAVNLSTYGYTGGRVGTHSQVTDSRFDDAKLWIDEAGGSNFNKLVFDDGFASAAVTPAYDAAGNLTNDGVYQFVYDAWNRLVQVKASQGDHSTFATYTYDGLGRRVSKKLQHSGDLDTTEYYYHAGGRQIEMRNGSEQTLRQYVWGTQYIDELVRMDLNGDPASDNDCLESGADASYYYHQDANYNVVAVTDVDGDVVQRLSFTSYGRPTFTDADGIPRNGPTFGPAGNKFHTVAVAWQGLMLDLETGISYNWARSLHHGLGRFMQRDPIGYADGLNLYEYVGGSPMNALDPSGLTGKISKEACHAACAPCRAECERIDPNARSLPSLCPNKERQCHRHCDTVGRILFSCNPGFTTPVVPGPSIWECVVCLDPSGFTEWATRTTARADAIATLSAGVAASAAVGAAAIAATPYVIGAYLAAPGKFLVGAGVAYEVLAPPGAPGAPGFLYRSGNKSGPYPLRPGDIVEDAYGMVHPTDPPTGLSTNLSIELLPTKGRVWELSGELPEGLKTTPWPTPENPGEVIIGPAKSMTIDTFRALLALLNWRDTGTKK